MDNKPLIGIIGGTGVYGNWFKKYFESQGLEVIISSRRTELTNIQLAQRADVVIVSVPIHATVQVINEIVPHVRSDALLCDFTSIKVAPLDAMMKAESGVTGIHPLFAQTALSLSGQKIVFCSGKDNGWTQFLKDLFTASGATVVAMTPEEHDHQMALIQALVYFMMISFAKTLQTQHVNPSNIFPSNSFRLMSIVLGRVLNRDPSLYVDMELENPMFASVLHDFKENIAYYSDLVQQKEHETFLNEFRNIKEYLKDYLDVAELKSEEILRMLGNQPLFQGQKELKPISLKQEGVRVGYLGPQGTYSHEAATEIFTGKNIELKEQKSISKIFESIANGDLDIGIVPAENSINGIVSETIQGLIDYPLEVSGSYRMPVRQCLLSRGQDPARITSIRSHDQALGQCRNWIKEHYPGIQLSAFPSTVQAILSPDNDESTGFIASPIAAHVYGLNIIASDISDSKFNETKFFCITKTRHQELLKLLHSSKTLLLLAVYDRVGVLNDILKVFADHNINLSGLHSVPSALRDWDYYFYLEVDAPLNSSALQKSLLDIKPHCQIIRTLGEA